MYEVAGSYPQARINPMLQGYQGQAPVQRGAKLPNVYDYDYDNYSADDLSDSDEQAGGEQEFDWEKDSFEYEN